MSRSPPSSDYGTSFLTGVTHLFACFLLQLEKKTQASHDHGVLKSPHQPKQTETIHKHITGNVCLYLDSKQPFTMDISEVCRVYEAEPFLMQRGMRR